jgi:hypothetical protein
MLTSSMNGPNRLVPSMQRVTVVIGKAAVKGTRPPLVLRQPALLSSGRRRPPGLRDHPRALSPHPPARLTLVAPGTKNISCHLGTNRAPACSWEAASDNCQTFMERQLHV